MGNRRRVLGRRGEDLAVTYLQKQGYKLIMRNYRCLWGEIDLIARDKGTLVFVEIKTRTSSEFGRPHEAVDRAKQRKLTQVATAYLAERHVGEDVPARFDVVAIHLAPSGPQIQLIKDAFGLE